MAFVDGCPSRLPSALVCAWKGATVSRLLRLAGVVLVVVVLLVPARGFAVPIGDPWVPPSAVTHDGVADPAGTLGGAVVPAVMGTPEDVVTPPTSGGSICTRRAAAWSWVGDMWVYTVTGIGGSSAVTCAQQGSATYASAIYGCLFTSRYWDAGLATWFEVGFIEERGQAFATVVKGSTAYTVTGACRVPQYQSVYYMRLPVVTGATIVQDGILSYRPGVGVPLRLSVVTTCSDASTVTVTVASGAAVDPAACVTGSVVSVAYQTTSGVGLGTATVGTVYQGSSCMSAVGACWLLVTAPGVAVPCANTDPACDWWGGTSAATGCEWTNGGAEMWAVDPADCEAARHDGYDVVPDRGTATATAVPTVVVQPTVIVTVNPSVNVSVSVTVPPVQTDPNPPGCLEGMNALNPASWVLEPLRCLLIPSEAFLVANGIDDGGSGGTGSACEGPLPGISVCEKREESKAGDWKRALEAAAEAFRVDPPDSEDCLGPGIVFPPPLNLTLYPAQACSDPGRTLASTSYIGSQVVIWVMAFLTVTRMVSSAVGLSAYTSAGESTGDKS